MEKIQDFQTFGESDIPTHAQFVEDAVAGWGKCGGEGAKQARLPSELMWGSFCGERTVDEKTEAVSEFGIVFHNNLVVGKGFDEVGEFMIRGSFALGVSVPGSMETSQMVMAASLYYPRLSPSQSHHHHIEFRLKLSRSEMQVPDDLFAFCGVQFEGSWYRRSKDGNMSTGTSWLAPTPPGKRTCGFFAVEFVGPRCGLEHTGTFSHWHGSGAEVRRAHDPALTAGCQPGDVVKMVNGEPLPHKTRSVDISRIIKHASRPMVLHLWREATPLQADDTAGGSSVDESNLNPPISQRSTNTTSSEVLNEELNDNTSNLTSLAMDHMQRTTNDLKAEMLGEIERKKNSLESARRMRESRLARKTNLSEC